VMGAGRRRRIVAILASCLLAASLSHAAAEERPGGFRIVPGARRLCSSNAIGADGSRPVEIAFTLYASRRAPSEVARYYADAHRLDWKRGQESISVRSRDGRNVLSVSPVSSQYPECGVRPSNADRTVIVVSQILARTR
jgi:hypothetical protein